MTREKKPLRAVLIGNCRNLEKALHYCYDVGKRIMGCKVKALYHVETPYGHVFVVGEKGLDGKPEDKGI